LALFFAKHVSQTHNPHDIALLGAFCFLGLISPLGVSPFTCGLDTKQFARISIMKEEVSKDKYSQMKFPALNNNSRRNCPIYLFT
jgi:hypothetical protein